MKRMVNRVFLCDKFKSVCLCVCDMKMTLLLNAKFKWDNANDPF